MVLNPSSDVKAYKLHTHDNTRTHARTHARKQASTNARTNARTHARKHAHTHTHTHDLNYANKSSQVPAWCLLTICLMAISNTITIQHTQYCIPAHNCPQDCQWVAEHTPHLTHLRSHTFEAIALRSPALHPLLLLTPPLPRPLQINIITWCVAAWFTYSVNLDHWSHSLTPQTVTIQTYPH